MLATEIISKLKTQIRIMWAVIIILSLLLIETNVRDFHKEKKAEHQYITNTSEKAKFIYNIPEQPVKQRTMEARKTRKKGNDE